MKVAFLAAIVVVLVAAGAWALAGSKPDGSPYAAEVCDVAGESTLIVSPEVAVTAPGHLVMPEVVVRANLMPEVVVCAPAVPEVAAVPVMGFEAVN